MEVSSVSLVDLVYDEWLSGQYTLSGRIDQYRPCDSRGGSPAPVQFGLTMAFFR